MAVQPDRRLHRVDVEQHWGVPGEKARISIGQSSDDDFVSEIVVERGDSAWTFRVSDDGVAALEDGRDIPGWLRQLLLNAGVQEVTA